MKPFGALLPFEEALKVVDENITPNTRTEIIDIDDASGRVLVEDVTASLFSPPFNRAAMDGYAVRAEDTLGASQDTPSILEMVGEIHAGDTPDAVVGAGQCIQIATGAMMPEGADAVVMVENTGSSNGRIEIYKEAGFDFYKIDPNIFAPAIVSINNLKTGKTFRAGSLDIPVMKESLGL